MVPALTYRPNSQVGPAHSRRQPANTLMVQVESSDRAVGWPGSRRIALVELMY
jgi:hypothetical protein